MKLNNISTYALNSSLRNITLAKQHDLAEAQTEVATGKKADLGLSLGAFSSSVVSIENQIKFINQITVTNSFAENRMSAMQSSITSMVQSANNLMGQVTAELQGSLNPELLETIGKSTLGDLTAAINTTFRGEHIFSGVNTDSSALVDYEGASGTAAKAAVQNAFLTNFGFTPDDPAAQTVTPAAMKSFIDGPYADLFNDANWQSLWSGSSDRGIRSKISTNELVENPTTAHAQAFRDTVAASVLMAEFSDRNLNPSAIDEIANTALEEMGAGVALLGAEQSKIGVIEQRVSVANERMEFQQNILSTQLAELTEVDPYEAALRLNQIVISLEASYTATARIQSLSLLNFI